MPREMKTVLAPQWMPECPCCLRPHTPSPEQAEIYDRVYSVESLKRPRALDATFDWVAHGIAKREALSLPDLRLPEEKRYWRKHFEYVSRTQHLVKRIGGKAISELDAPYMRELLSILSCEAYELKALRLEMLAARRAEKRRQERERDKKRWLEEHAKKTALASPAPSTTSSRKRGATKS